MAESMGKNELLDFWVDGPGLRPTGEPGQTPTGRVLSNQGQESLAPRIKLTRGRNNSRRTARLGKNMPRVVYWCAWLTVNQQGQGSIPSRGTKMRGPKLFGITAGWAWLGAVQFRPALSRNTLSV